MADSTHDDADPRAAIRALDIYARECVDAVFPEPVCDTVFGKACCVSVTPSGSLQVISFLNSVADAIEARFAIEKDRLRRQGASEENQRWMDELDDRLRRIRAIATNAPAASETNAESAESAEPVPHADPR
jgi:hypothetical protein